MYVCPSLCLFFSPSVCLSIVYPSIQTSIDKCHFVCPVRTWKLRHAVQTGSRVGTGWRLVTLILHLSVCLSVCLSICLSIHPNIFDFPSAVCPSVCLSICLSVHLSVCLSICLSIHIFKISTLLHLSICLSVCLSVHLSVCPSVCLSIHPNIFDSPSVYTSSLPSNQLPIIHLFPSVCLSSPTLCPLVCTCCYPLNSPINMSYQLAVSLTSPASSSFPVCSHFSA